MASTYSPSLRLELMATGDQSGTWGDTTNTNLGSLLEQAITGVLSVAQGDVANLTLTALDGAVDQSRNAVVELTGALTGARNVVVPTAEKVYLIKNSTSGGFALTVKTSGGTGVSVAAGTSRWVYCDGTNVVDGLVGTLASQVASAVAITGGTIAGLTTLTMASGAATPATNDAAALGTSSLMWSDLFLASGAVVNFNNGDVTITHAANLLTFAGGAYSFGGAVQPSANDGSALGTTALQWSDLFLASGAVVNWDNGDVTITHSANTLAFAGASSGYTFDALVTVSGPLALGDNELRRAKIIDYGESVNALGSAGGTRTVNMELGNVATLTVSTSANTLAVTNPPTSGVAGSLTLIITNGGSQTFNWPSGMKWPGGTDPTLTTSGVDIVTLFTIDAGTTWYGFPGGIGMAT